MESKTYTAQELREESDKLDEFCRVFEKKSRTPAMLRYAADLVERCEDYIKTMQECGDNMYSKVIEDILTKILRGDAGKEAK